MKILVIEDDADIASNIGQYFEDKGHQLDFAGHCYQLSDGRFDITSGILRCAWQLVPGDPPSSTA
jgi:DNA-binding response OmpR family regulator